MVVRMTKMITRTLSQNPNELFAESREDRRAHHQRKPDDNLNEFFGSSQGRNSQGTVGAAPNEPQKKSEVAESKDEPKSPSHGQCPQITSRFRW